jgi:hypothetical protein
MKPGAGSSAHVRMFFQDSGRILHRHLIVGERHHARLQLKMKRMQGRMPKRSLLVCDRHDRAPQ